MQVSKSANTPDLSACFKAYDIRGIVDDTITSSMVEAIGAAFVDTLALAGQTVLVGGDMRPSSPELMQAFARGACQRGALVRLLGLVSTDELYFASGSYDAAAAMFTASHNPAEYNGIKLTRPSAVPLSSESGLEQIRLLAEQYLAQGVPSEQTPGSIDHQDVLQEYAAYLRSLVDLSEIRPLKVVVDAGNGMSGLTTPAVLGDSVLPSLPLTIIPLYFELDGTFPNHVANPLDPDNLRDLQRAVVQHQADIGLAFDGDADRCCVVDEQGQSVSPSAITALVARREIARAQAQGEERPRVIHNLITSRAVPELITAEGGKPVRTRVGHSFIKAVMASEKAIFGGEHSAHYYFRDFFNADTGMLAAMHVLAALGENSTPLSRLAAEYAPYATSGEMNSQIAEPASAIARVRQVFDRPGVTLDELDGVTFSEEEGQWWFNLRPSNTEPYVRFNGEARDEATLTAIRTEVLTLLRQDDSA